MAEGLIVPATQSARKPPGTLRRYIEYCLGVLEEKLQELQEKQSVVASLANSMLDRKRSDEEKRSTSVEWMVKEVMRRLTCLGFVPVSPTVYQFEQGVIQKTVEGTVLQSVQNVFPVDKKSERGLFELNGKITSRRGSSAPCSPRRLLSASDTDKVPFGYRSPLERPKEIFRWMPCVNFIQKKNKTTEFVPIFGKRNKNEEPDCPSLAQVVADDLEETLRRQTHPPPDNPHFWKRHRGKRIPP